MTISELFTDWRKHPRISYARRSIRDKIAAIFSSPLDIANSLEYRLFIDASSVEEYLNQNTLIQRLRIQLNKLHAPKSSEQVDGSITYTPKHSTSSNGRVPKSSLQQRSFPDVNATHHSAVSITTRPVLPNFCSSSGGSNLQASFNSFGSYFPQHANDSVLSNLCVPGGGSNVDAGFSSFCSYFPQLDACDVTAMSLMKYRARLRIIQKNGSVPFHTTLGKSLQSESSKLLVPPNVSRDISEVCNPFPGFSSNSSLGDIMQHQHQKLDFQQNLQPFTESPELPDGPSIGQSSYCHHKLGKTTLKRPHFCTSSQDEMAPPARRPKLTSVDGVSLVYNSSSDQRTPEMVQPCNYRCSSKSLPGLRRQPESSLSSIYSDNRDELSTDTLRNEPMAVNLEHVQSETRFNQAGISAGKKIIERKQETETKSSSTMVNMVPKCSKDLSMGIISIDPMAAEIEDIRRKTGFNQDEISSAKEVIKRKVNQETKTKSSSTTVNIVSLTEYFTSNQIEEHIMSLWKQAVKNTTAEETGIAANRCQLCAKEKLYFEPEPIYCLGCGYCIKPNENYYNRGAEAFDTQYCFCACCYKKSRGGNITLNGISVSKKLLDKKKNVEGFEEGWVECNKCKGWQHQICALYNDKRDLDSSAEYICPICRLKEIETGTHEPFPKTAMFSAKDLPSTNLSDHIEKRLLKRLNEEREDMAKFGGNENLDQVLAAENLYVRVVSSVDKQLKVKKQFLDIFPEKNYPAEFSYRSKVILLFQQIEGVDVCLFVMYVQEFGSECAYPNRRCVYISYLDSVKHFRPQRTTRSREALRTFVYHEILIGYLDFCKKRGFTTCYIWACPPSKGDNYVFYCHPATQKTPNNDQLRRWYHSMLEKASTENIVVGSSNIYDHLFVSTEKCGSQVTASRLPYFDGDYWSGAATDLASKIEQECEGGKFKKMLNSLVTKRALKAMGHENPSRGTAKDILVMHKLGEAIHSSKENFIVVHLQHICMRCHKVIVSGKRWFCTECKELQECERCHAADSHTSIRGKEHTLCSVMVNDVISDTKEENIIDNGLFENRHDFLSFCQKNHYQFDTLRHAKYSTMMFLDHLKNQTLSLSQGTKS